MSAADPRRLHPAVGGEVGGAEADALHPGARAGDGLDVRHPPGGLEDGVDEDRTGDAGLGLELREQPVDVVDVFGTLDLRDHDDVQPVADLGDERREVVQGPRGVQRVDAGPQLGVLAELRRPPDVDEALAGRLLVLRLDGVLQVAEQTRRRCRPARGPWQPSSGCSGRRSGSSGRAGPAPRAAAPGRPRRGA